MVRKCCIVKCGMRADRDNVKFFRFPMIETRRKKFTKFSEDRQRAWLKAVNRKDLKMSALKHSHVCSRHFVSGKSSHLTDTLNTDYVPSLHLGYSYATNDKETESLASKAQARYLRSVKRTDTKKDIGVGEILTTESESLPFDSQFLDKDININLFEERSCQTEVLPRSSQTRHKKIADANAVKIVNKPVQDKVEISDARSRSSQTRHKKIADANAVKIVNEPVQDQVEISDARSRSSQTRHKKIADANAVKIVNEPVQDQVEVSDTEPADISNACASKGATQNTLSNFGVQQKNNAADATTAIDAELKEEPDLIDCADMMVNKDLELDPQTMDDGLLIENEEDTSFNVVYTPPNPIEKDSTMMSKNGKIIKRRSLMGKAQKGVLKTWLYKNRYQAYPTDKDKQILSDETGFTILQINNWFINARRRLLPLYLKEDGIIVGRDDISHIIKSRKKKILDTSNPITETTNTNIYMNKHSIKQEIKRIKEKLRLESEKSNDVPLKKEKNDKKTNNVNETAKLDKSNKPNVLPSKIVLNNENEPKPKRTYGPSKPSITTKKVERQSPNQTQQMKKEPFIKPTTNQLGLKVTKNIDKILTAKTTHNGVQNKTDYQKEREDFLKKKLMFARKIEINRQLYLKEKEKERKRRLQLKEKEQDLSKQFQQKKRDIYKQLLLKEKMNIEKRLAEERARKAGQQSSRSTTKPDISRISEQRKKLGNSPAEKTFEKHNPTEKTFEKHSPTERTCERHSPTEKTFEKHSNTKAANSIGGHSDTKAKLLDSQSKTKEADMSIDPNVIKEIIYSTHSDGTRYVVGHKIKDKHTEKVIKLEIYKKKVEKNKSQVPINFKNVQNAIKKETTLSTQDNNVEKDPLQIEPDDVQKILKLVSDKPESKQKSNNSEAELKQSTIKNKQVEKRKSPPKSIDAKDFIRCGPKEIGAYENIELNESPAKNEVKSHYVKQSPHLKRELKFHKRGSKLYETDSADLMDQSLNEDHSMDGDNMSDNTSPPYTNQRRRYPGRVNPNIIKGINKIEKRKKCLYMLVDCGSESESEIEDFSSYGEMEEDRLENDFDFLF